MQLLACRQLHAAEPRCRSVALFERLLGTLQLVAVRVNFSSDVYGGLMDAIYHARKDALAPIVALANKLARIIWAIMTRARPSV